MGKGRWRTKAQTAAWWVGKGRWRRKAQIAAWWVGQILVNCEVDQRLASTPTKEEVRCLRRFMTNCWIFSDTLVCSSTLVCWSLDINMRTFSSCSVVRICPSTRSMGYKPANQVDLRLASTPTKEEVRCLRRFMTNCWIFSDTLVCSSTLVCWSLDINMRTFSSCSIVRICPSTRSMGYKPANPGLRGLQ